MRHMHISIATLPEPPLNIERELAMLKVALLYADTVTLNSPTAALLLSATERATSFSTVERLSLMVRVAPLLNSELEENYRYQLEVYRDLCQEESFLNASRRTRRSASQQLRDISEGKSIIEDKAQGSWSQVDQSIDALKRELELDKLDRAMESGRLTVNSMQTNKVNGYELLVRLGLENSEIEHLIPEPANEMTQKVLSMMLSPDTSYPFVDDKFGKVFRLTQQALSNGPQLNRVQEGKAKNVSLVSELFELLPGFETASFDEILSISDELSDPLIRFRGAVSEYAELIESASWDSDFKAEAHRVFEEKIKPAVLEIEERVEENSYLCQLTNQVQSRLPQHIAVALTSGATPWVDHQISALAALSSIAFDVVWAQRKKMDEAKDIEREKLFFYYKLGERLR